MQDLIHTLPIPKKLLEISKPPKNLFFLGNKELLNSPLIVAIVGTRKPNAYAKDTTTLLVKELKKAGVTTISGGALGIDIITHTHSLPNTIMVSPSSLDILYPSSNQNIIKKIIAEGLLLSEYENTYYPKHYSFIQRNRLVIGLSDIVIIPQADLNSGSMQSAQMAIQNNKPLYVLSHKITESLGTNYLLQNNLAKGIFHLQDFIHSLGLKPPAYDEVLEFCSQCPHFEDAFLKFGDKLLEYELEGKIERKNGRVFVL